MWTSIRDPELINDYRNSAYHMRGLDELCSFLRDIASQEWPQDMYAVTSLGNLRLTTSHFDDDHDCHGHISISWCDGSIDLSYFPPGVRSASAGKTVPHSEALDAFELYAIRMFHDAGSRNPASPEKPFNDADSSSPIFKLGTKVIVVKNARNQTIRIGTIIENLWHHKYECWVYYIEQDGKKIKKRYFAEDLEEI